MEKLPQTLVNVEVADREAIAEAPTAEEADAICKRLADLVRQELG